MDKMSACLSFHSILFAMIFLVPEQAVAGLLLPAGGSNLIDGSGGEDIRVPLSPSINPGSNFRFFGSPVTNVHVAENGYLAFSQFLPGESDFITVPLGNNRAMIAPLWDDYLLSPLLDNSVRAEYVAGQYLSVTWSNVRLYNETVALGFFPDSQRSTQVVWFEGDISIRGFEFKKDDIAFGYKPHTTGNDFGGIVAVAGLNKGDGTFSAVKGTIDGSVDSTQGSLLAADEDKFLLFRPGVNGLVPDGFATDSFQGGYYRDAFSLTSVPEASSFWLIIAVGVGAITRFFCSSLYSRA